MVFRALDAGRSGTAVVRERHGLRLGCKPARSDGGAVIIARFSEHERYDINVDAAKVIFMATTAKGSYFTEILDEGAGKLREARAKFKQVAAEYISAGIEPGEICLS